MSNQGKTSHYILMAILTAGVVTLVFSLSSIHGLANKQSHVAPLLACKCSEEGIELFQKSWGVFMKDAPQALGCPTYSDGWGKSEMTLGYFNGTYWTPTRTQNITLTHEKYASGVKSLLAEQSVKNGFIGPLVFDLSTNDIGMPRRASQPPAVSYCLHASNPPIGCRGSIVLPIDPDQQSRDILDMFLEESGNTTLQIPYDSKMPLAYWKGSRTGHGYRADLIPKINTLDNVLAEWSPPSSAWEDVLKHQIILAIDGNSFSSLYKRALLSTSAVIRVFEMHGGFERVMEWFEPMLEPYVHYVPVTSSPDIIGNAVQWLLANPEHGRAIADAGAAQMQKILSRDYIRCYSCMFLKSAALYQTKHSTCLNSTFEDLGWSKLEF